VARSYGSHCLILLPEYTTRSIVCVHLSYRSRLRPGLPLCVGQVFFCDTVIQASRLYPRGPRSGQGYSVPVPHHLLTSSEPLKDTPRFPGLAGYTRSLGCAGAPRPPMSGSELSLTIPSRHVALCDSGRPAAAYTQFLHRRHWPSPFDYEPGSTKDPTNPLHVGVSFRSLTTVHFRYDLSIC